MSIPPTVPDVSTIMPAARPSRGRLRIYFGAAAGVGKTFAMLSDAHVRRREGSDVVVGLIETHGWRSTAALLTDLEVVPPLQVESRGARLHELRLEAALSRRPDLILIDDLAHMNTPGCRHDRRWQDVQDLLEAGISVFTTLNVQHLESLKHMVERIAGVEVRERVPDHIFEQADEIELIDLPPEEILKRWRSSEAGRPGQDSRAQYGSLALHQLVALRALALRLTGERVQVQMQSFRQLRSGQPVPSTAERLLVCIGPTPLSARLVRSARRMAAGLQAEWIAVYIEPPAGKKLSESERRHAIENLRLADLLGAETVTLSGHDIATEVIDFARMRNVSRIVIGKPFTPRWRDMIFGSLVSDLVRRSGMIDVYVINGEAGESLSEPSVRPRRRLVWGGYGHVLMALGLANVVGWYERAQLGESWLCLLFLVAVLMVAVRGKIGPAVVAALLAMTSFAALIGSRHSPVRPPLEYLLFFTAVMGTGLLVSLFSSRLRLQFRSAYRREARTAALHAVSRDLATSRGIDSLLTTAARHASLIFSCPAAIMLPDEHGRLTPRGGDLSRSPQGGPDQIAAQWAFEHGRPAGIGTDTLRRVNGLHVPLVASRSTVGVVTLYPIFRRQIAHPGQRHLVEAFAHQVALAVECDHLADLAQRAKVEVEAERLRNALLSSVSHDLRTPLAAITGAASSLVEHDELLDRPARRLLAETIAEESEHLARLVSNLLDMTRLEGGHVRLKKVAHVLEDVIGTALTALERRLAGRTVRIDLPAELPPVLLDGILIQEVLVNLIDNALKYSPPGSTLEIGARLEGDTVTIGVADNGPGLSADELERVFEKFYRGSAQSHGGGVGLGLAICRAIVHAHGGRTWAENRLTGGAMFRFSLPVGQRPALPETDRIVAFAPGPGSLGVTVPALSPSGTSLVPTASDTVRPSEPSGPPDGPTGLATGASLSVNASGAITAGRTP